MYRHSPDWPDDRSSSFPVLSAMVTASGAEMELAVGTAVSLSLELALFAFGKQIEAIFSASSASAEFTEMAFPEMFWIAELSASLWLLICLRISFSCSERELF